ncbi:MAG: leucine-rich repeat domain-containing protein, partial [Candidatus Izemoplasmatales bacterium]|nr:leucine-rich repeat domain-containing protein [Candidatus Izemoplasmatales bacterium]
TMVAAYAFENADLVTKLVIPNSVTTIAKYALRSMSSLQELSIPFAGVSRTATELDGLFGQVFGDTEYEGSYEARQQFGYSGGEYQFNYVPSTLLKVTLTDTISIPAGAFSSIWKLREIILPEGLQIIGSHAFKSTINLGSILFPEGLKTIEYNAFHDSGLSAVVIPNSVESIGGSAFAGMDHLQSFTFEKGSVLQSIGAEAFSYSKKLRSFVIPSTVTSIGMLAFRHCDALTSISFEPGSMLTVIGHGAFSYLFAITSFTIPRGVTVIEDSAFRSCSLLQTIIFEEGSQLTSIGDLAFESTALRELSIPSNVVSIGRSAFSNITEFESIHIPSSVSAIDSDAFRGDSNLVIYAASYSMPIGWEHDWNSENLRVIWGSR